MALSDWTVYVPLLDALREQSGNWGSSKNFTEFDEAITRTNADFRGGEGSSYNQCGLDSLVEELLKDFVGNYDLVYEQIRLAALAIERPDLGEDWAGCFVSKKSDGTDVWAESRYAAPASWEKADIPAKVPASALDDVQELDEDLDPVAAEPPGLTLDPETGLLYDEDNWYLMDGKTVVTEVEGADQFVDPKTGIRYRLGVAVLWPDPEKGLLYDDVNWYLKDGKTVVTEVEGTDEFVDPMTSIRYRNGEPVPPPPKPVELPPAAEKQLVSKLVEVRTAKVAQMFDELQAEGWSPVETPEEAAELRAQGDETAFTVDEVLQMIDARVEQRLGS